MFGVWCSLETLENRLITHKQAQTAAPNTRSSPRGLARDSKPQQICSIMPLPPPLKFYILPLVLCPSLNIPFVWLGQKKLWLNVWCGTCFALCRSAHWTGGHRHHKVEKKIKNGQKQREVKAVNHPAYLATLWLHNSSISPRGPIMSSDVLYLYHAGSFRLTQSPWVAYCYGNCWGNQ